MGKFNEKLRALRKEHNMTQDELAEKMGVSRSTVIAWENDQREMRTAYVRLFCSITGLSEDDILLPIVTT